MLIVIFVLIGVVFKRDYNEPKPPVNNQPPAVTQPLSSSPLMEGSLQSSPGNQINAVAEGASCGDAGAKYNGLICCKQGKLEPFVWTKGETQCDWTR